MDEHHHHHRSTSPGAGVHHLQPPNTASPLFSTTAASSRRPSAMDTHRNLQRSASAQSTASTSSLLQATSSSSSATVGRIAVHVISPPLDFAAATPPTLLSAKAHHNISKLKRVISKQWPGKPNVEGIRLIHAGRVLQDEEALHDLVRQGQEDVYVHLVVRPDAWTEVHTAPLPSPAPRLLRPDVDPLQSSPYFSLPVSTPASASASASASHNTAQQPVPDLDALPAVLHIIDGLYYHRYTLLYEYLNTPATTAMQWQQRQHSWSADVEQSLGHSLQVFDEIEGILFAWQPWSKHSEDDDTCTSADWASSLLNQCLHRRRCIQAMIERPAAQLANRSAQAAYSAHLGSPGLIVPQSPAPSGAMQQQQHQEHLVQQLQGQHAHQQHTQDAAPLAPIPSPSLTELVTMFLPVFFLTVKIGIVLYLFTRNASPLKRAIMYGGSALYLLAETIKAWSRRQRRLDSARRRAARAARGETGNRPTTDGGGHRRQGSMRGARDGHGPTPGNNLAPLAPQRFTAHSVTQYKYWLQRLAFTGLEGEDLELGFHPRPSQARAWLIQMTREQLAQRRRLTRRGWLVYLSAFDATRAVSGVFHGALLYFHTLLPEMEELRSEQLRKRDNLIRDWWNKKGKEWVEGQRQERAERGRQGEGGDDEEEEDSPLPAELPRLLRHPYVLRLLQLERSEDGLVRPIAGGADASTSTTTRQINIQEELDALRDMQRNNADAGGGEAGGEAVAAAAEGEGEVREESDADEDGDEDEMMGFF